MTGPQPIDEVVGAEAFRNDLADYLERTKHGGQTFIVRNQKRRMDMAVVIPTPLWERLGRMQRDDDGLSTRPDGDGGYLTRDQLARYLHSESERIGEETYQLTAAEMRLIRGLITEIAGRYPDEELGQLADEWAARLGKRTAPTS
jgi:hypothetical protein